MPETVSSTSDDRTKNNVMRHEYRVLNDVEKALMKEVKDTGLGFTAFVDHIAQATARNSDEAARGSRELSIAKTKIEEAVMWAVKHITR